MKNYLAEMPSYTYAVKAQRILRGHGISSEVRRRGEGCGYDLLFDSPSAFDILDKNAVPYELKNSGGAL